MRAPGQATRDFLSKGVRSFVPTGALSAVALLAAITAASPTPADAATAKPAVVTAATTPDASVRAAEDSDRRLTPADLQANPGALHRIILRETSKYQLDGLDRAVVAFAKFAMEHRDPVLDADSAGIYGIDAGMWAWMMRQHAQKAGLGGAMEGIKISGDLKIEANDASSLQAMFDLRNDPVAATKIFVSWYESELRTFDGETGKPPTLTEKALIALTDNDLAADASYTAANHPTDKLAPTLMLERRNWQTRLMMDPQKGYLDAKTAVEKIGAAFKARSDDAYGPFKLHAAPEALLDEDLTTEDLRKDPDRLLHIAVGAAGEFPAERRAHLAALLVATTRAIDQIRGGDTTGGIFAVGDKQWLSLVADTKDQVFKNSFTFGLEYLPDGKVRSSIPEVFTTAMRLRENAPIAAQIVMRELNDLEGAMKMGLKRAPSAGELVVAQLFGLGAAERFIDKANAEQPLDMALEFSPGDKRRAWSSAFRTGKGGFANAALLRQALDSTAATYYADLEKKAAAEIGHQANSEPTPPSR